MKLTVCWVGAAEFLKPFLSVRPERIPLFCIDVCLVAVLARVYTDVRFALVGFL